MEPPEKMQRLVKLEGFGNVRMAEDDVPAPEPDQMLVRLNRSLISRGSELFWRYVKQEAVSPQAMGYSAAGEVVEVGTELKGIEPGMRAMVTSPHAQYGAGSPLGDRAYLLPDGMTYETATFMPLATSAVAWTQTPPIEPTDTVVVLGQGIVGQLYAQAIRERRPHRVITADSYPLRRTASRRCGADHVIDVSAVDPVEAVRDLTGGRGADVVVDCVGGHAGVKSFQQAQEMVKNDGVIHLIALYQGQPGPDHSILPLSSRTMMRKMLIAGDRVPHPRTHYRPQAAEMLMDGRIQTAPMITHRLPWQQTPDAYHMLYRQPETALAVILEWDGE